MGSASNGVLNKFLATLGPVEIAIGPFSTTASDRYSYHSISTMVPSESSVGGSGTAGVPVG